MPDSSEQPLLLCTACGKQQATPADLCQFCGAPLTPFASSDWVMAPQARGFAAYQATHEPRKLIVVVGMWIWMVPMFGTGLWFTVVGMWHLKRALQVDGAERFFTVFSIFLGIGFMWLSAAILYRSTSRFLSQPRSRAASEPNAATDSEADSELEAMNCLECGKSLPANANECPSCGWSFGADD
jgi:hypothetical protein